MYTPQQSTVENIHSIGEKSEVNIDASVIMHEVFISISLLVVSAV